MMLCTAPALRHRSAIDWSRQSQSDSRGYPAGGHRFAAAGPPCRADRRAAGERRRADGQICRRAAHPARRSAENFWPITAHFGFVQVPDLPAALRQAKASGCEIELRHAIFFNARDAVVAKRTHNLAARARLLLFAFMLRNAVRAVDLFRIPTDNFIEIGRLVEI